VPLDTGTPLATTLAALALTGALGGLGHCTGMCGPLVALVAVKLRQGRPAGGAGASGAGERGAVASGAARAGAPGGAGSRAVFASTLTYHFARILVYVALGTVAGTVGSLLGLAGGLNTFGAAVSIALGAGVLAVAAGYAGLLPRTIGRYGAHWWTKVGTKALRRSGLVAGLLLGALNGLLPCGLMYGALLIAAGTGSPRDGALAMLVFGATTLPALVVIQTGAGLFAGGRRVWLMRLAAVVVLLVGVQLCLRGLATLGVVSSVHWGRLVLW
jgi:uncharacterized protein